MLSLIGIFCYKLFTVWVSLSNFIQSWFLRDGRSVFFFSNTFLINSTLISCVNIWVVVLGSEAFLWIKFCLLNSVRKLLIFRIKYFYLSWDTLLIFFTIYLLTYFLYLEVRKSNVSLISFSIGPQPFGLNWISRKFSQVSMILFLSPPFVGILLKWQWRTVFLCSLVIFSVGIF